MAPKLKLLPANQYKGVNQYDPIKYYYWPVFGRMYRQRVELALAECTGGERVLEVGFGCGLTFLNLNEIYKNIWGLDLTCDVSEVCQVFASHDVHPILQNGDVLDMPYEDNQFDTVLLISILEHLKTHELERALHEIIRVLKPGGQVVYGVPVERPLMVLMFRLLGYNIREHHFSTEKEISQAMEKLFNKASVQSMKGFPSFVGSVYEIGHYTKP